MPWLVATFDCCNRMLHKWNTKHDGSMVYDLITYIIHIYISSSSLTSQQYVHALLLCYQLYDVCMCLLHMSTSPVDIITWWQYSTVEWSRRAKCTLCVSKDTFRGKHSLIWNMRAHSMKRNGIVEYLPILANPYIHNISDWRYFCTLQISTNDRENQIYQLI